MIWSIRYINSDGTPMTTTCSDLGDAARTASQVAEILGKAVAIEKNGMMVAQVGPPPANSSIEK